MPRTRVTAMLRRKPRWSSRRIAHTANWQVNDESTRMIVAGRIRRSPARQRERVEHVLELRGGHVDAVASELARTLK